MPAGLTCRSCRAELTRIFVDLGLTPLANAFVHPDHSDAPEKVYPLKSYVCDRCHLVQLEDVEPPDVHFHDHYAYFSSFSNTGLEHASNFAQFAIEEFNLGPRSHVIEVGSNDGYLLQYFAARGLSCLGIDPAANCAAAAWTERGVPTEIAFFGAATAARLRALGHAADLMIANNVFAHVPDIDDFSAGFASLLKPAGTAVFEFPHVLELIRHNQFDTIYHEHHSYLSLLAVEPVLTRNGLQVINVERLPIHGGSLRLVVRHTGHGCVDASVGALRTEEHAAGLDRGEIYSAFGPRVRALKKNLLALLASLVRDGKRIVGYGAPAKGNTLLNYCGIGTDLLAFTVDRNPHKQGMLLPGSRIPIVAPERLFAEKPEFVLILPWNLRDEIMKQLNIGGWGGRFILPIPQPSIVDAR
jgi:SAM-dependent methyltransferase